MISEPRSRVLWTGLLVSGETGDRLQVTGDRLQVTGYRLQVTACARNCPDVPYFSSVFFMFF